MPFRNPITYDSIPTVQRARGVLAGSDPNEAVRYLVDAAVDLARRNGTATDPHFACADAIVRRQLVRMPLPAAPLHPQDRSALTEDVLLPVGLPVAIVAELALATAQDAVHFIRNLEGRPGAPVSGADKYLRGFLHACTLLNALAANATMPGLSARLFGREITQQQVLNELDARSMRRVLF